MREIDNSLFAKVEKSLGASCFKDDNIIECDDDIYIPVQRRQCCLCARPYFMCKLISYGLKGECKKLYKEYCKDGVPFRLEPLATIGDEGNIDEEDDEEVDETFTKIIRKRVFVLSCVLSLVFGEKYCFAGKCQSTEFVRIANAQEAFNIVNECVAMACEQYVISSIGTECIRSDISAEINQQIQLGHCEFYTYEADRTKSFIPQNPFLSPEVVSYKNILIYCRNPKRVIFIGCLCISLDSDPQAWSLNLS